MKRGLLYVFLFGLICHGLWAQPVPRLFHQYTMEDGLSQNTVLSMLQDRQGFLWFGTQDGLNRFDGSEFKIFRHDASDSSSLSHNYVWTMMEDAEGLIWAGTFGGGLNVFDPRTGKFRHYRHGTDSVFQDNVFALTEYPEGIVWAGTNNGLVRLDKATGDIQWFMARGERAKPNNFIGSIALQPDGTFWLGTDHGLVSFDTETHVHKMHPHGPVADTGNFGRFNQLLWHDGKLLAITGVGLLAYDLKNGKQEMLLASDSPQFRGERVAMSALHIATPELWWIATRNGLVEFNPTDGTARLHRFNAQDYRSLSHDRVYSLCSSADGVLWVGTLKGISTLARATPRFGLLRKEPDSERTLPNPIVNAFLIDRHGRRWVGTSDGLAVTRNDSVTVLTPTDGPHPIPSGYILSLMEDGDGHVWVGVRGSGLCRVTMAGASLKIADVSPVPGITRSVQHTLQDGDGTVWAATSGSGLVRVHLRTLETETFPYTGDSTGPAHPFIYYLLRDSFDNFWVATASGGLNLFDPVSGTFRTLAHRAGVGSSLSSNIVLCLMEDAQHRLWAGTAAGLNLLTTPLRKGMFADVGDESLRFRRFVRSDGLPNEVIYGMEQADDGRIFISTNNGLLELNDNAARPVRQVYTVRDGLQDNEFNMTATFRDSGGRMYFGGIGGLTYFHPDELRPDSTMPPVHITGLRLYNAPVPVATPEAEFSLPQTVLHTDHVRLRYHDRVITFDFAALNYTSPGKGRMRYMLEGFDSGWVDAEGRSATYTNLRAGTYAFRVIASNGDGIWNMTGDTLHITMPPPPWLTWYAFVLYGLVVALSIFLFVRMRVRAATRELRTRARIAEAREQFRRESAANFHDEAGGRIARVQLYTSLLKEKLKGDDEMGSLLANMERNTRELTRGMRDFLWAMDTSRGSLHDLMLRLGEMAEDMFAETGMKVKVEGTEGGSGRMMLGMNARRVILQLFKEAMNNILKHADAQTVTLQATLIGDILTIALTDDGKGFDDGGQGKDGYGTGIMRDRAASIGGALNVRSQKNAGTTVTFTTAIAHLGDEKHGGDTGKHS